MNQIFFPLIEVSTRKGRNNCIIYKILRVLLSKISVYTIYELLMNLRNESDIFSVDRGINQKRTENCIIAHCTFVAKVFRFFFAVDLIKRILTFFYICIISIAGASSHKLKRPLCIWKL